MAVLALFFGCPGHALLRADVGALLGYRAFHQQYQDDEGHTHDGRHPEDVEVGQRRPLLLAQSVEGQHGLLMRPSRVATLLIEERPTLRDEGVNRRVEGVEELAYPRQVELLAALLNRLGQRRADAAALVAQQGE